MWMTVLVTVLVTLIGSAIVVGLLMLVAPWKDDGDDEETRL